MLRLIVPLITTGVAGAAVHLALRSARKSAGRARALEGRPKLGAAEMLAHVAAYGGNSNSFMTLYPGFEYFASREPDTRGAIAYVETGAAWVAGAEPMTEPGCVERLLAEFAEAARQAGRRAIILPIRKAVAESAVRAGYRVVQVGSEPVFRLDRYPRTGKTWLEMVPTAKHLYAKGAEVREFRPGKLSAERRAEIDSITREWLESRKTAELGFLNQVDLWHLSEHKRYFWVELKGQCLAVLGAIPVWNRRGWYLIDLVRRRDTPAGSTELLLLQAMRILRDSGAEEITMGVAPLSGLEQAGSEPIYRVLRAVYENGNWLYNFKSLHQYKLKFDPTESEPRYIAFTRLGIPGFLGLSEAFMPGGLARATASGMLRTISRFSLSDMIKRFLAPTTVVRSVPPSWARLLHRCKLSVCLLAANLVAYLLTVDSAGRLRPEIAGHWAYSWATFSANPARALLLSPFLHFNPAHLSLNVLMLVAFTGGLEYLAGTGFTALAYFMPMFLANPLTSLVLRLPPTSIDVGASLGIFGTAGALALFLRRGAWFVAFLAAASLAVALATRDPIGTNHFFALALGLAAGRISLRS